MSHCCTRLTDCLRERRTSSPKAFCLTILLSPQPRSQALDGRALVPPRRRLPGPPLFCPTLLSSAGLFTSVPHKCRRRDEGETPQCCSLATGLPPRKSSWAAAEVLTATPHTCQCVGSVGALSAACLPQLECPMSPSGHLNRLHSE